MNYRNTNKGGKYVCLNFLLVFTANVLACHMIRFHEDVTVPIIGIRPIAKIANQES
jgi:hypothetical protein